MHLILSWIFHFQKTNHEYDYFKRVICKCRKSKRRLIIMNACNRKPYGNANNRSTAYLLLFERKKKKQPQKPKIKWKSVFN